MKKISVKFFGKLVSVLIVCVVCIAGFTQTEHYAVTSHAATLAELQAKQKSYQAKQKELKNRISSSQGNIAKQEEYQQAVSQQIEVTEQNIYVTEQRIALLEQDIAAKIANIEQQEADIAKGIADFKERLRTMYMQGDEGMASILIGSSDFYDVLAKMELVQRIAARDDQLIENLNTQLNQLNADKAVLETSKAEADAEKASLEQNKNELSAAYDASTQKEAREKAALEEYKKNQAYYDKMEEEIDAAIKAEIARLAKIKTFVGGTFMWPLPYTEKITSYFVASRTLNGVTKPHKGIDISASGVYGKPIVASNAGTVIVANNNYTPGYSYGKYVMIDHGGGWVTLYGHCSSLNVKVGQAVNTGDTIAYVGSTGDSTGPHLHFEIREQGVAINPVPKLKG